MKTERLVILINEMMNRLKDRFTRPFLIGLLLLGSYFTSFAQTSTLVVQVQNVPSNKGQIMVNVYNKADGYPVDETKAMLTRSTPAISPQTVITFDLPEGNYAVAILHDEDGDGIMGTNFLGIPNEAVAASNNARRWLGPPKFADAAFKHPGGRHVINIRLE